MVWDHIWKAILIILEGTVLLKMAGRKTISQMTLAETVLKIAIGTLLIQPVVGKNIWITFLVANVLVGTLLVIEFLQMKSDSFEKILTGKALVVIDNWNLNQKNLKKLRLTVDQLETKLRQNSVSKLVT
ncbi:YetF domain-containing protein [Bacillus sp. JJ1122]